MRCHHDISRLGSSAVGIIIDAPTTAALRATRAGPEVAGITTARTPRVGATTASAWPTADAKERDGK